MQHNQFIAVLDFGSQYTQLIARRIREHHVYSEILPYDTEPEELLKRNVVAIILSGGPSSVYEDQSPQVHPDLFNMDVPILGICYGMQLVIQHFGGRVQSTGKSEYGYARISPSDDSQLLANFHDSSQVWMSHGDAVDRLGQDIEVIAHSENEVVAAVRVKNRPVFGVQFHPEVSHTLEGNVLLSNFLFQISHCRPTWTPANFIQDAVDDIRQKVGKRQVIVGLSGGVDSSVVGTLMHKALGDRSICVFINNGLLRKNEVDQVMGSLKDGLGLNIHLVDDSDLFLSKLEGITEPEQKRKIIGNQFIYSFRDATRGLGDFPFLAQGTLYPDVIESGGSGLGPAATIKSHHNVGGLPEDMDFELIEPIRDLFKDEVRRVGRELGLPEFVLERHPFPVPGLAVRILGAVTEKRLQILREADHIFIDVLKESGEYYNVWQAFAVLVPVKTVGVMGDARTYENIIALRAVTSLDGMTADWYHFPPEILKLCSNRIVNEVNGVNRVVYDITGKPPGTIEWE